MVTKKLYKVEVKWAKGKPGRDNLSAWWEVRSADGIRPFANKLNAVRCARQVAKANQPSSLMLYTQDGRYQTEYTYPRARDPRRSKG